MGSALAKLFRHRRARPDEPAAPRVAAFQVTELAPIRMRALVPLAAVLVAAAMFCGVLGYLLARHSDARNEAELHQALAAAVKDYRASVGEDKLDQHMLRLLEQASGLRGLRFDIVPSRQDRAVQSLVEDGRIVGWLSWERNTPVTAAMTRMWPLLLLSILCLVGFAALALWQVRRSGRALEATQAQVHTLAIDSSTGLPNIVAVNEVLDRTLANRRADQSVALLLLGLRRFDEIVETMRPSSVEQALGVVADRLDAVLPPGATLGFVGPGRYAAVLVGEGADQALSTGRAIVAGLAEPLPLDGEPLFGAAAHIGIAIAPEHGIDRAAVFRRAELALESAMQGGPGPVVVFNGLMEAQHYERQGLKRALKQALAERAFDIEYQPIVAADGYRITGVEALLRWSHPFRGPVSPTIFIPLAEQNGMMAELGALVLRRALADAQRWPRIYVSINLSPVQVRDSERVREIAELIRDSHIDPARVVLEITEGVMIDDPETIKANLQSLRALGVRIALDDFGAGYSSLAYLREFPFDKIKIDRGFVAPLGASSNAGAIIQAIVALGRALDLGILVEGVETEQQRVLLRLAGCDEMQGFLFSRPLPAAQITLLLAQTKALPLDRAPALTA